MVQARDHLDSFIARVSEYGEFVKSLGYKQTLWGHAWKCDLAAEHITVRALVDREIDL